MGSGGEIASWLPSANIRQTGTIRIYVYLLGHHPQRLECVDTISFLSLSQIPICCGLISFSRQACIGGMTNTQNFKL